MNTTLPFYHLTCEDIFLQRYCCPTKASNPLQKIFLKQVERIFCPEFAFVGGCQHSEKSKKHPFGQAAKQQNKREKIRAYGTD
ncbi:hypothetical protein [Phocaeicola plebeius]|uniref:hypothetical protein n=1 Tax=Phocaeicola plebeius TaxID=310297 RepID=UPI0026F245C2|nr:hypothetical protein [Phocaeicola plebeius]